VSAESGQTETIFEDKNRTPIAKFQLQSLAELSSPNEFAIAMEASRSTTHFQACHRMMGKRATFKVNVWGRMESTAKT